MKHKICKGKIYVTTMPILGVLKRKHPMQAVLYKTNKPKS